MIRCFSLFSKPRRVYHILLAGLSLSALSIPAAAELMLFPTRIVLEGNQRAAQVELINNSSEVATYRISLVNRRMNETGSFSEIDEPLPGEAFADDLLRYSPRQVTLAPGAAQTVRVMVRKPANLAQGEYRSHLLFSKQPAATGRNNVENLDSTPEGIGVEITALVGASIPVIVRHGNTTADVKLTDFELVREDAQTALAFVMNRKGSQSVYGDLTVTYTPHGGKAEVVGRANGVAVYTPNPLRRASISLQSERQQSFARGVLHLTFREPAEAGGKLLAEASLTLP